MKLTKSVVIEGWEFIEGTGSKLCLNPIKRIRLGTERPAALLEDRFSSSVYWNFLKEEILHFVDSRSDSIILSFKLMRFNIKFVD